jgi:Flp pilus assembly protein TadG
MLVVLMFGGSEAGHFVWTQHKLAEAVRDGARYASRLPATGVNGVCDTSGVNISNDQIDAIKLITRTGQLADANAKPVVPGWTAAQVVVAVNCDVASVGNQGIYSDLGDVNNDGTGDSGPVVTVAASNVPYPSLFNGLAVIGNNVNLSAKSNAVVIGI